MGDWGAFSLFLTKYVAEIRLPGNGISPVLHAAELYTAFLNGISLVISIM
jgi:hypothetical protein